MKKYLYVMSSLIFLGHISVSFGSDMPEKETEENRDKGKERIYVQEGDSDQIANSSAFGDKDSILPEHVKAIVEGAGLYAGMSTTGGFREDQEHLSIKKELQRLFEKKEKLVSEQESLLEKVKSSITRKENTEDVTESFQTFLALDENIKATNLAIRSAKNRLLALDIANETYKQFTHVCQESLDFLPMLWQLKELVISTTKDLFPDHQADSNFSNYDDEKLKAFLCFIRKYGENVWVLPYIISYVDDKIVLKPEEFAKIIPPLATGREAVLAKFADITRCLQGRPIDGVSTFFSDVENTAAALTKEKTILEYRINKALRKQEQFLERVAAQQPEEGNNEHGHYQQQLYTHRVQKIKQLQTHLQKIDEKISITAGIQSILDEIARCININKMH